MSEAEALPSSCPKVRRRVIGSNVWLLSFGDLVTLLLGFFVAIIAYALQHPVQPQPQVKPDREIEAGTTLADDPSGDAKAVVRRAVTVPAEAFDPISGVLTEKWRKTLKEQLNPDDLRITSGSVFGCIGETDGDREQRRFAVMGRTLAVTGQVLDMGTPERELEVETPGEFCEDGLTPGAVLVAVRGQRIR